MAGAMMLAIYGLVVRHVEGRPVRELAGRPAAPEFAGGLLMGFALYTACVLILMALGSYRVDGVEGAHVLLTGMATALATGVYEELRFRGTVFRLAEEWFGTWAALVISSVVFGWAHAGAEGATMQGLVSIAAWAGPLLAGTYLMTGRLWLGIGLHAAWNDTQGTIWSGVVSGSGPREGFVRSSMRGSAWLTGGVFGIEASLIAAAVCSGVAVLMLTKAYRRGRFQPPGWKRWT